jgi:hypothetical protein
LLIVHARIRPRFGTLCSKCYIWSHQVTATKTAAISISTCKKNERKTITW